MSKHTLKGFLYHSQYSWQSDDEAEIRWHTSEKLGDEHYTLIGPHNFEVNIPSDFDVRSAKVANLRELKQSVQAEFAARVTEIDRKINELLAIEN